MQPFAFVPRRRRDCLPLAGLLPALAFSLLMLTASAQAAPSTIGYTGQLISGTSPVSNHAYDFQFTLYSAATGGSQLGSTVSVSSVPVVDGIFYVELNFGGVVNGQTLYLQTAYRQTGGSSYTTQPTRKLLSVSAYADYATNAGNTNSIRSKPISAVAPTTGQVLTWDGSLWSPLAVASYTAGTGLGLSGHQFSILAGGVTTTLLGDGSVTTSKLADGSVVNAKIASGSVSGSKLSLPLAVSKSSSSDLFSLTNTGTGTALTGATTSSDASTGGYSVTGVFGAASGLISSTSYYHSAVLGDTSIGNGVIGFTSASAGDGVVGYTSGSGGFGVVGGTDANGVGGVYGYTGNTNGYGVEGQGGSIGVYGSGATYGVYGYGDGSYGVYGTNNSGAYGYLGHTLNGGTGVYGVGDAASYNGVVGEATGPSGFAIEGIGDSSQSGNYAGYFSGNVYVGGTLSKAGGSFKIDHPLDPAHKYLSHSFVESPDMKNIYDGTITTDAEGKATVTMPEWFEALNQDFRYQLTCMGQFAQAIVATKVHGNQFTIRTDKPNVEVSWQVTGTRHDAWANAHRIPVEEDKPDAEQGTFLNPKEFGMPASAGVSFARQRTPTRRLSQPVPPAARQLQQ